MSKVSYPFYIDPPEYYINPNSKKRRRLWIIKCIHCGQEKKTANKRTKYCSRKCQYQCPKYINLQSNSHRNQKVSEETKMKISKKLTGRLVSKETIQRIKQSNKISAINRIFIPWNKGIPWTENHKLKLRQSYINGRKIPKNCGNGITGFRKDIGHFVRSTWEANIARIMKYEKIEYQYEPQRFDLGELGTYLPDFYIPQSDYYIEVKGYWREKSKEKVRKFSEDHDIIIIEKDGYNKLKDSYKEKVEWEGYR